MSKFTSKGLCILSCCICLKYLFINKKINNKFSLYHLYNKQSMINFNQVLNKNQIIHKPNWPYIPEHPYKTLLTGCSGSGTTSALLNLISQQRDINKIHLYAKDPYQSK